MVMRQANTRGKNAPGLNPPQQGSFHAELFHVLIHYCPWITSNTIIQW
jgi:hypothetical protein